MAFIKAPKISNSGFVLSSESTMENAYNAAEHRENLYMSRPYELSKGGDKQQWNFVPVPELPGVFKIQNKFVPTLYITAPEKPRLHDLIFLDYEKMESDGSPSKTQLWILGLITPADLKSNVTGFPVSVIQNYSSTGFVIDIGSGNTSRALQLYYRRDNNNQSFYNDLSPPQ